MILLQRWWDGFRVAIDRTDLKISSRSIKHSNTRLSKGQLGKG